METKYKSILMLSADTPEDYGKGFYVYRNEEEAKEGNSWVQYCYNIDYLNGWLYGAVQAKCKQIKEVR